MPHSNNFSYEFETHRLDVAQRVLTRNGQSIPLTPKATEVLLMLLHNAGQLVDKELLINEVWPDSFVEEANLTQNIFMLRRALQDNGRGPKFIETVARRGYRFVAPVKKIPAPVVTAKEEEFVSRASATPILAALPFINATGDAEMQYLGEGIPENIINSFSGLPQLRVISRSTVFRYKNKQIDPQVIGQKLGADVLLMGKVSGHESALSVSVELVRVDNSWQLWGQTFPVDSANIFEIQDEIKRQIARALHLPLTREDEKHVAKRYTENVAAYQAYLEGRYHWSRYTRTGIERAIDHFGRAIDLDPNYALAYAGIVDCYLRLATNYLPPEDGLPLLDDAEFDLVPDEAFGATDESLVAGSEQDWVVQEKVKLRHEWDWKGAERELRRANELKTDYPAAHQWHAAYMFSRRLCEQSGTEPFRPLDFSRFPSSQLPELEEVQVLCTVAREQLEVGNYKGGCLVLQNWWTVGDWPKLQGLSAYTAADLLLTTGMLADYMASTGQFPRGHKHSEALLNGALALCAMLGLKTRVAEARAELGGCYYRQGFFDLARTTLEQALLSLSNTNQDLASLCLFRLAVVDRHAGRLHDSVNRLTRAEAMAKHAGPWILGRYHQEFGTTLRDLGTADGLHDHFERALFSFRRSLNEFEAVGNLRYVAAVRNNIGFVLLELARFEEAETHLFRAFRLFETLGDDVRCSQVEETLAQLYLGQCKYDRAEAMILKALTVLEKADEDVLLSEALVTYGRVLLGLHRESEAKGAFDGAHRIAERCGHYEGAGLALLLVLEVLRNHLLVDEEVVFLSKAQRFLAESQQASVKDRLKKCINMYAANPIEPTEK
ncbi:MAG TPA: tetratricopeptide repeat protein [Pyrinomonadaceae bacterium]|nr:tetratricopeptide repeat protein [Pyrinomonadaceae bacterium]